MQQRKLDVTHEQNGKKSVLRISREKSQEEKDADWRASIEARLAALENAKKKMP